MSKIEIILSVFSENKVPIIFQNSDSCRVGIESTNFTHNILSDNELLNI